MEHGSNLNGSWGGSLSTLLMMNLLPLSKLRAQDGVLCNGLAFRAGHLHQGLVVGGCREHLQQEEKDILEDIKTYENRKKGKDISVLVLSITVVSLEVESVWAWAVSWDGRKARTQVVEEGGDDEVGVLGP